MLQSKDIGYQSGLKNRIRKKKKKDPGCLGGSGVKPLPLTQGVSLESGIESHIGVPVGSLLLSWPNFLPLSLSLSLSHALKNKIVIKKNKVHRYAA